LSFSMQIYMSVNRRPFADLYWIKTYFVCWKLSNNFLTTSNIYYTCNEWFIMNSRLLHVIFSPLYRCY
jgi:hypothetical protein